MNKDSCYLRYKIHNQHTFDTNETKLGSKRLFNKKKYICYTKEPTSRVNPIITNCLIRTKMFKNQLRISTISLWKHAVTTL